MKKSLKPVIVILLSLGFLAIVISVNWLAFRYLTDQNYFIWYLKNGALIGILVSFIGLIWGELDYRKELLSAHPGEYLHGCFALLAIFFWSVGIHLDKNPQSGGSASQNDLTPKFSFPLDRLISVIVISVIGFFALAWLVIVAPLNYFIIIFSGAIARQELQGKCPRAIAFQDVINMKLVKPSPKPIIVDKTVLASTLSKKKLPYNITDISLARKPFAVTQAITAFILFTAKMLLIG